MLILNFDAIVIFIQLLPSTSTSHKLVEGLKSQKLV